MRENEPNWRLGPSLGQKHLKTPRRGTFWKKNTLKEEKDKSEPKVVAKYEGKWEGSTTSPSPWDQTDTEKAQETMGGPRPEKPYRGDYGPN